MQKFVGCRYFLEKVDGDPVISEIVMFDPVMVKLLVRGFDWVVCFPILVIFRYVDFNF